MPSDPAPRSPFANRRDRIDIEGLRPTPEAETHSHAAPETSSGPRRPFLQIWYRCCNVYGRLAKNATGTHYEGRCPRCLGRLEVPIGEGGTSRRSFEAG